MLSKDQFISLMNQFKGYRLDWDSNFFGYSVGKITLDKKQSNSKISTIKRDLSNYRLIYVFSENQLLNDLEVFSDEKVILEARSNKQRGEINKAIKSATVDDFEQLLPLAITSGRFSRFRLDEKFVNNEFQRLYQEWLTKSIKHVLADEVLIWRDGLTIAGFVTLKKSNNVIDIGLISTDTQHQGKGIGGALVRAVFHYAISNNYPNVRVPTQRRNTDALAFYKKNDFVEVENTFIYHVWN